MATTQRRMCGRPLVRIVKISKRPMGVHGGHIRVLTLECGHTVTRTSDTRLVVGRLTGCPTCP